MLKLTVDEIISKIENEEQFYAITEDGAFSIAINEYVPYVCCAIHNGGNFGPSFREKNSFNKNG
jgi:hypothetical protein